LNQRTVSLESQTLRALLEMRELMLRGAFKPGERLREVPLAARLNVSRTPLRLVLDRLAQEGLLRARPTGGFVASEFSVEDIRDAIEIRGVLEGAAAHRAAERFKTAEEVAGLQACVAALDILIRETPADNMEFFARYIDLNGQFHAMVLELAKSAMLSRSMEHVLTLPFASPNAFFLTETETQEGKETILLSQAHHRAIASAIIDGEASRAELLAREHSRLARTNLENALKLQQLTRIPGASLIKFPEAM
jgi:GntR family transcriptional regulator of vanillate catabolism